ENPAVGDFVIGNDGIAVITGFAVAAEALPERISRNRKIGQYIASGLVEDRKREIDPLHVLGFADGAVSVWRRRKHGVVRETVPLAFKVQPHRRTKRRWSGDSCFL